MLSFKTVLSLGFIRMNPDQILYKNSEYILVKEFTWNNRDSCVYRYKADKIYTATVIGKKRHSRYVGIPGKGDTIQQVITLLL